MKKKNITIIAICTAIAVAIVIGTWLLLCPKVLGNINASFTEQTTSVSEFSFTAQKGDRVRFSFQSNITAGDLEIVVYNSNGNEVYVLDHAKALETFYAFDRADTYTLRAEYTEFIGNFRIAVYPTKEG